MKRRYKLTRSVASAATLLSAGGLAGFLASAPPAGATVTAVITSTWTGGGTSSNDTGPNANGSDWSDSASWSTTSPDAAPASSSTISALTFPDLASCDSEFQSTGANSTTCYSSNNDLTGITAGTLEIDNPPAVTDSNGNSSPGYNISGNGITLTGGLTVTGNSMDHSPGMFSIPLTLTGSSQAWSMPGSTTDMGGNVTGASTDLTVQASSVGTSPNTASTNLQMDGQVETKSFTFAGQDATQTGPNSGNNGFLELNSADVNGTNSTVGTGGNAVNIEDAALVGAGSVGALSVKGGYVSPIDSNYSGPVILSTGGATFDSSSQISFVVNGSKTGVVAGTDYSQIKAAAIGTATTGAVDLGGASLSIQGPYGGTLTCVDPAPGTVFTLVSAASLTGQLVDSQSGQAIPDGGVTSMSNCAGTGSDQFRINYTSTALTATTLDPTTTSLNVASNSPQVGQADLVTATVTSGSGATPTGTVTFLAQDINSSTDACDNVPLVNGQASCNVTFANSGAHSIYAPYTPDNASNFASSDGGTSQAIQVQPISGASSSNSASASGSNGSATATNSDNGVAATASGGAGTVTVSNYASNPSSAPTFNSDGTYFDVQLASGSTFNSVSITVPNVPAGGSLYWFNPSSGWSKVVGGAGSTQSPYTVVIDSTSSPNLSQLTGTVFGVAAPGAAPGAGYDLFASDGGVFNLGGATFYGSKASQPLNKPVVGGAKASNGNGYYLVASDGGVFNFGPGAAYHGSMGGKHLNAPIVGMAVDPATGGYWLVGADGGVFNFDAPYLGSKGSQHLNAPIVGIAAAPGGNGYYLVASDGGVFNFGTGATFQGSEGNKVLNKPVVGMTVDPATGGYWLVASDGGIFNFNAPYDGSEGNKVLNKPVVGMTVDPATGGYWLVASDGGIFNFNAPFDGSKASQPLNKPIVGMS